MKVQITQKILFAMALLTGCTGGNPALNPVLTFTDGLPPTAYESTDGSTSGSSREWPDQTEDGSTDDLVHLRVIDAEFPQEDAEVDPDTAVPMGDAGVADPDVAVPQEDAEVEVDPDTAVPMEDAAPPEPDAQGLGCLADPGACPVNTICDGHSRECVPDCFGIICTGATPFCIPPHPPFNTPACGQCLNDYSCAEGWHCNLADQMCNINE